MTDHPDKNVIPTLRAAMTLVAATGLRGLSLRPLAEQLGTTVSALSHRFGRKDALVAALIDAACEDDAAFLDIWLARIQALGMLDGALMADLVDAILADMAGPEGLRTQFFCELLQGAPPRPEIVGPLARWSERRLSFWRAASDALGRPELGEVLHAYVTDEAAHGLALGGLAPYRWLRRLCLHRLCDGLVPQAGASDLRQFGVFSAALDVLVSAPGRYRTTPMTEWQAGVARHISSMIVAEGADAITHRAVAARAGLANSTLAYHFPRHEDLLKAGLNDIIVRAQGVTDDPASERDPSDYRLTSIDVARATFAVALAATRMPDLKAFAADMRRRRGENYLIHLDRQVTGKSPFDLLSAQALAMTGIGQLILDAAIKPMADASGFELVERLQKAELAGR